MAASVTADASALGTTSTFAPQGGATATNGGSSTTTLTCSPCCGPPTYYLSTLFGAGSPASGGKCNGAISNTSPVTLYCTFYFCYYDAGTAAYYSGISSECLPTSATTQMICDDRYDSQALRWVSPGTSCSSISSPTTRFQPLNLFGTVAKMRVYPPSPYQVSNYNYYVMPNNLYICGCTGYLRLDGYLGGVRQNSTTDAWDSCSPFAQTFGAFGDPSTGSNYPFFGRVSKLNSANPYDTTGIGYWAVTLTP